MSCHEIVTGDVVPIVGLAGAMHKTEANLSFKSGSVLTTMAHNLSLHRRSLRSCLVVTRQSREGLRTAAVWSPYCPRGCGGSLEQQCKKLCWCLCDSPIHSPYLG